MSVEPGLGGQKFINNVTEKIDKLIKLRNEKNYNYVISIDGGINDETIKKANKVDFVISGSFICMSDNYQEQINKLR
jgi:ribulose-phosphate 3-epimerase